MPALCYSLDESDFRYDDPWEAYDDAVYNGMVEEGEPLTMWEADSKPYTHAMLIDAGRMVEYMCERAYDEVGEYAEDYLTDLTIEQVAELEQVLISWFDKNADKPRFYGVSNVREISWRPQDEEG